MRAIALCPAAVLLLSAAAAADTFRFQLAQPASALQSTFTLAADYEGTLIGNYDPATTPDGTQTRPGLFGGSGNQPIPTSVTAGIDASNTTHPAGSFTLVIDDTGQLLQLTAFEADLLNGASPDLPLTITFLYQTFRTFNPNSLYPGGIPLPIPFGEATLSTLSARLAAPGAGALIPTGQPDTYTFTLLAPLELTLEASVLGQPFAPAPATILVPLTGELTLDGDHATASIAFDLADQQVIPGPLPGGAGDITNQPLDLPTVLPAGQTAHLLLTLLFQQLTLDTAFSASLLADGALVCPADFNGDGFVDFSDYLEFLNLYDAQDPAADLNADGFVDFIDYLEFLNLYEQGC